MPMFKPFLSSAQQWLHSVLPCQFCGLERGHQASLCQDCWNHLPWFKQSVQRQEIEVQVACHYAYPLDRVIQQFKYEQQLHFQILLTGLLKQLEYRQIQAIVPMPISTQRLAERGYNQSVILAQRLGQHLNIPVWQPIQRQHQHAQKGLSRLERLDQIEQQFKIAPTNRLRFRRVLMLDDVVTTGSSLKTLERALAELGCRKIEAVCIAAAQA
ncbi:ComF family protein [Acinetobacter sp. ANC 4910]|uniref:ComF family protein n=1 Tax=Acinetobacter sp. ANC 4910 TaxID=2529850 RepID=UPI00103E5FB1|nr:phosphoribosyltransferase family protein [Acinetobacter sp. ANC 4910]TCB34564.1 ComF family protein [Acinetobacter sp. ANC 4910]